MEAAFIILHKKVGNAVLVGKLYIFNNRNAHRFYSKYEL